VARTKPYVVSLDELAGRVEPPSAFDVGGKGARLVWLARRGFEIPKGWVLEAGAFRSVVERTLPRGHDPRALLHCVGRASALERMARARELLLVEPLEPALARELGDLWERIAGEATWGLAVRSSATCEDDELTAMAGLASTELGVRGASALHDAVKRVWASAVLPRALGHLASRGVRDVAMAVVVQAVVPADASGVMFTRPAPGVDPSLWAPDERLVNATLGLGAPIVNGAVSPDMLRIEAGTGKVRSQTVARKPRALVVGAGGPDYETVAPERASAPALSPPVVEALSAIADRLEKLEPVAHDVEFAVARDHVYLVQARPVVGTGYPEGGDAETVWSRANVGEALPGAATPLTWSVARGFSERGFRQAFASLGCSVPRDASLVANVHGRFYLNLTQFMRIAAQVPGLDPHTLMRLGGGDGAAVLDRQLAGVSHAGFVARLPVTLPRLLIEQARLAARVDRFERRAREQHEARRRRRLDALSSADLAGSLREVQHNLDVTGTLMLACASGSLGSHLLLKTLLGLLVPQDAERLSRALTAGVRELESAKPGIAIARIASLARGEPGLAEAIVSGRARTAGDVPAGPTRVAIERFLDEYGERAVREPEIATPRWYEDQAPVFAMIASTLRHSGGSPGADPEAALRRSSDRAELEMAELVRDLPAFEVPVVRALVRHTKALTHLRERMRAWVTRALGAIRRVALEVDRRLLAVDARLQPGSVFFCTMDELVEELDARRPDLEHLVHRVRLRQAEHARDVARPDPPVTFVGRPPPVVLPPAGGPVLRGLPASGGVVEGRVRVLSAGRELADGLQAGEVLVARTTDVGLTPLFLLAAAVVTELGGPLSHAAIVAREYGVPAVVNVPGATLALRNGERVRVDGNRGMVERLAAAEG
jgi:pyruvate,water dikinase